MVLVGDNADAADDWIAEHISTVDVCVTSAQVPFSGPVDGTLLAKFRVTSPKAREIPERDRLAGGGDWIRTSSTRAQ